MTAAGDEQIGEQGAAFLPCFRQRRRPSSMRTKATCLVIPSGRLCPIDIVPCIANAQMTAFMNQRVKSWAAKH